MPSPFPGMDPYFEDPEVWPGFHHSFLAALKDRLGPAVRPRYFVHAEERVYVVDEEDGAYRLIVPDVRVIRAKRESSRAPSPDKGGLQIAPPIQVVELLENEVHEHFLEIVDRVDRSVVTVIELLSPTNKAPHSKGRSEVLKKRRQVYATSTNWVEIDLLREGARLANLAASADSEYQVFLSRAGDPREACVWPIQLKEKLPVIGIPLRGSDQDVPVDLQAVIDHVYDSGSYDMDFDYRAAPAPPLTIEQERWADGLLRTSGLR
jgi:hypothetical protein